MTFETFYQSDEETWPDQKNTMAKRNTKTMTKTNTFRENLQRATPETCELWDIWSEWWGDMAWQKKTKTKTMTQTMTKTIPETYDIWDTDYNSDNWEPEFMTIFVVWQLRVTLDSIRNSCDVSSISNALKLGHHATTAFHQESLFKIYSNAFSIQDTTINNNLPGL